jgi:hypothetical protein
VPRPTDLTPELSDQIARFVRAGNWPVTAAGAAGVPERTFFRWMARGKAADELDEKGDTVPDSELLFWQFRQQIKRAESESEVIAVGHLMKEVPHAPTAVIAWLERRFRKRWSRMERQEVEIGGAGGRPLEVMLTAQERVRAKLDELAARGDIVGVPKTGADEPERVDKASEGNDAAPAERPSQPQPHAERRKGPSFA